MRKNYYATVNSIGLQQRKPSVITIECFQSMQLPRMEIVGIKASSARESKLRVFAALHASGFALANRRIIINFVPQHIVQPDSSYDLAIAVAILVAQGKLAAECVKKFLFIGELNLDGTLNAVTSTQFLPALYENHKKYTCITAKPPKEALILPQQSYFFKNLREIVTFLQHFDPADSSKIQHYPEQNVSLERWQDKVMFKTSKQILRLLRLVAISRVSLCILRAPEEAMDENIRAIAFLLSYLDEKETIQTAHAFALAKRWHSIESNILKCSTLADFFHKTRNSIAKSLLPFQIVVINDISPATDHEFRLLQTRVRNSNGPKILLAHAGKNLPRLEIFDLLALHSAHAQTHTLSKQDLFFLRKCRKTFLSLQQSDGGIDFPAEIPRQKVKNICIDKLRRISSALACLDNAKPAKDHFLEAIYYSSERMANL